MIEYNFILAILCCPFIFLFLKMVDSLMILNATKGKCIYS